MDNLFYTYAYLREDGTPYYIGKGRGRRAYHPYNRNAKCPPKERILFLKTNLSEEEAIKHEIYMIAIYGRKDKGEGILHNFTDGGEGKSGVIDSEETRRKKSQHMVGEKNPMFGRFGKKHPLFGKTHKEETKHFLSKLHTGRKWHRSPDGKEERMFHPHEVIEGWVLGRKVR